MDRDVIRYKKTLTKNLPCTRGARRKLIQPFQGALNAFLEEKPAPSMEDLIAAFGPPEEMAKTLCEQISAEEHCRFQARHIWKCAFTFILAALLVLATVYVFFLKQRPISSVDRIMIEPETTMITEAEK